MLERISRAATYYYHPDHLGSVSVVSNHKGEPYERVEYLPFGEIWIEDTDPATSYIPFRFTSKELDEETGLYYYGARYYEPTVSRWMSADPAGFALINPNRGGYSVIEATNWYSYVSNNPVRYVDPTGMCTSSVVCNGKYIGEQNPGKGKGSSGGSSSSNSSPSGDSDNSSSSGDSSSSGNNWAQSGSELRKREKAKGYIQGSQSGGSTSSNSTNNSSHKRPLLLGVVGKIWTLPWTVLGTFTGLTLVGSDRVINGKGKITIANNATNFITSFKLGGAITLGNSVIYAGGVRFGPESMGDRYDGTKVKVNVGKHEEAHTYQYQLFGPFFPSVYLLSGGMWRPSWLEHAADDYSETGGEASWLWGKRRKK